MLVATSATVTAVPKSHERANSPPTTGSRRGWRLVTMGPRVTRPRAESAKRIVIGVTRATPPAVSKWGATTAMPLGAKAVLRAARGSGSVGGGGVLGGTTGTLGGMDLP